MNFIPATPTYEQMRDGMLQAVAAGPVPGDKCTVWSAFAQFGIGVGATGVVNGDGTVTITSRSPRATAADQASAGGPRATKAGFSKPGLP